MNVYLGILFVKRTAALIFFLLFVTVAFYIVRTTLQMQPLTLRIVATIACLQLPHLVYLSTGLASYWVLDNLQQSGQFDLLLTSGIQRPKILHALLWPTLALSLSMAIFNLSIYRKASSDFAGLRTVTELSHIAQEIERRGAFHLGGFQLLAQNLEETDHKASEPLIHNAILSYQNVILHSKHATIQNQSLALTSPQVTTLLPHFSGSMQKAHFNAPNESSRSFLHHYRMRPALTLRALAFALNILVFVLLAWMFNQCSKFWPRHWCFVFWLLTTVGILLSLENLLTNALRRAPNLWVWAIPLLPLVFLIILSIAFKFAQRKWTR